MSLSPSLGNTAIQSFSHVLFSPHEGTRWKWKVLKTSQGNMQKPSASETCSVWIIRE